MAEEPIDDIEAWSKKLSAWRRDCLRRLATCDDLTETDYEELLAMVKSAAGFKLTTPPPAAVPFTKAHFGGGSHQPMVLKGIRNIQGINRLQSNAAIGFGPDGLTIVYGRNGSGKSGFVRILRTACRTRVENPAKLKVLADVYGGGTDLQSADIIIDVGGGDITVPWKPQKTALPELSQVAVFDSLSASLYVDGGNQIRYLPFGLALPHRLNTVGLILKERLEAERATAVGTKVGLTSIAFDVKRETLSQSFNDGLNKNTTDAQIETAATFSAKDQARLDEVSSILTAGATAAADLGVLVSWVDGLALECEMVANILNDSSLTVFSKLKEDASAARSAANLAATDLFTDDPLPGVGSETWRVLWAAARDYSTTEAYPGEAFPVTKLDVGNAACVLCQQPLLKDGAARLERFQKFMDDTLDVAATKAEALINDAIAKLPDLKLLAADDFVERLEQIRKRDKNLADDLATFQGTATKRRKDALARLNGETSEANPVCIAPTEKIKALAAKLKVEKEAVIKANEAEERTKLVTEKAALEDLKVLAANRSKLVTRRDLLVTDAAYEKALAEVQTKGITQRANELIDKHLTSAVVAQFNAERARFDIMHLKIGLSRKSGQTKAEFDIDPQTKVAKVSSDFLSEGEQRALALAGFLTEVVLTEGAGPIVVDDPVSSLDRDRGVMVAERLAEEAVNRQVIVFTHDIVHFNELCAAAEKHGIEPVLVALFSDANAAGKVDPAGMVWKGLNVSKRIKKLKNDFAPLPKLHTESPNDYDYKVKHLYGRMRDTYERLVEEVIFKNIVQRGVDVVQTQMLRYVTLPDELAIRFHEGMTLANTYSHDNPSADTVPIRKPDEFLADLANLEQLVEDFKIEQLKAEAARPEMKPKK